MGRGWFITLISSLLFSFFCHAKVFIQVEENSVYLRSDAATMKEQIRELIAVGAHIELWGDKVDRRADKSAPKRSLQQSSSGKHAKNSRIVRLNITEILPVKLKERFLRCSRGRQGACLNNALASSRTIPHIEYLYVEHKSAARFKHLLRDRCKELKKEEAPVFGDIGVIRKMIPKSNSAHVSQAQEIHNFVFLGEGLVVGGVNDLYKKAYQFELVSELSKRYALDNNYLYLTYYRCP